MTDKFEKNEYEIMDRRVRELEREFGIHEAICAERYQGIRQDLNQFSSLVRTVGFGLIAGMGGILVKLVFFT